MTDDFSPVVEILFPSSASLVYKTVSVSCVKLYEIHFMFYKTKYFIIIQPLNS